MKSKWMVSVLVACLLGGCVPSLHPWFTDKDVVFEEKLLGAWKQKDEDNLWIFEKGEGKEYRLTITSEDKEPSLFEANLVKIGGKMYMDLCPGENSLESTNEFFRIHLLPVHQLLRIDSIQSTVEFRLLNPDTIQKLLEAKPNLLAHESPGDDDGILFTASTEKLQKFIVDHTDDENFFAEANTLTRRTPLFSEKDFTFEPKLAGRWIDNDGTIYASDAVNNQFYRILAIRSKPEGPEVQRYGGAIVTINRRRFIAAYRGRWDITVSGGSDADRTPDLLLWIEQVEPTPQYRVMDYNEAVETLKLNDEQFKSAMEKFMQVRWIPLVSAEK